MNRASWEGFRRLRPDKRPFLLTGATYNTKPELTTRNRSVPGFEFGS